MSKQILLEMYKQYSLTLIHLENRRQSVNNWVLGASTIIVSAIITTPYSKSLIIFSLFTIIFLLIACCYNKYLKRVVKAKYEIIDELENDLGNNLNQKEWKKMKNPKFTGSNFERWIFIIFILSIIAINITKYFTKL